MFEAASLPSLRQPPSGGPARSRTIEAMMMSSLTAEKRRTERALPPITKVRSSAPPARPGGLDNVDGGLERRGYSQMSIVRQGQPEVRHGEFGSRINRLFTTPWSIPQV